MSKIIKVGTADVPHIYNQDVTKEFAFNLFSENSKDISRMIGVFDNALIDTRHFCFPTDWFATQHNVIERSHLFQEHATKLAASSIKDCLEKADADYDDFDHIMFISSTGITTPTIDAHLINELKLDTHIKRTPIWGLGCVAGAVGLSRAYDYTKAHPKRGVLVVAVEMCSLAFQKDDFSKSNIVALALFSDGGACSLVVGDDHRLANKSKINLKDSLTTTYYDSLDVMGWEVVDNGFKAIFSKDIPNIVRNNVKENVEDFTSKNGLSVSDLKHYVLHPGGAKVLDEYEQCLGLENGSIHYSRKVLKEHGNMSSPTVMYVLNEFLEDGQYEDGDHGMISALGPGFSSELLLFDVG